MIPKFITCALTCAAICGVVADGRSLSGNPTTIPYTLERWRQEKFGTGVNAGNAADDADPDGDGVPNLLEYAFGSDPTAGYSAVASPSVCVAGDNLVISYFRRVAATDVAYTVEESEDLITWRVVDATPAVLPADDGVDLVQVSVPLAGRASLMLRVRVTALPPTATGSMGDDLNGNGLPDAWELARGWTVTAGLIPPGHGRDDDPDGDGLTNLEEFGLGTNPDNPDRPDSDGDGLPDFDEAFLTGTDPRTPYSAGDPAYDDSYGARGYAAVERWSGFAGGAPALDAFRESSAVNLPAEAGLTRTRTLTKSLLLKGVPTPGGVIERVRGWITPSVSGLHTLSVTLEAGSEAGEALLRLSPGAPSDSAPFLAEDLVRLTPEPGNLTRGAPVSLEAGVTYYYELWLRKPDATSDARLDCAPQR